MLPPFVYMVDENHEAGTTLLYQGQRVDLNGSPYKTIEYCGHWRCDL